MAMPYRKNLATGCMRVIDRTTLGQRQHNAGNLRYILRNRLCIFLIVVKSGEPDEIDQASPPASRPSIHFSLGVISLPIIQLRTAFLSEEDHKDGSEVGGNYKGNVASLTHMNDFDILHCDCQLLDATHQAIRQAFTSRNNTIPLI